MDVQLWTWILVGISFTLYFGIAIWARASSTKDFYIAGGGVSPLANGMATAADWMSAASFISMAGLISFSGYDGSVYLMGWTGGYVLLALHKLSRSSQRITLQSRRNMLIKFYMIFRFGYHKILVFSKPSQKSVLHT